MNQKLYLETPGTSRLQKSIAKMESYADTMTAGDVRDWHDFIDMVRNVQLQNWADSTSLNVKYNALKSTINEMR